MAARLWAFAGLGLAVCALGLPSAAARSRGGDAGTSCRGTICVPFVFAGTGAATRTDTIHNPDGSTSSFTYRDTFSWHVSFDVSFGGGYRYQAGWNASGVQADTKSSFTGTSTESCIAPSGGSCVVGGGGPSCSGAFAELGGIPLELLVFSPPQGGVWKVAMPAHQASQRASGSCSQVGRALDDTCDPLWQTPFPGQGENSPVTAQFSLQPRLVLESGGSGGSESMPVSASKTWSCGSGTSSDQGSISWSGTVEQDGCIGRLDTLTSTLRAPAVVASPTPPAVSRRLFAARAVAGTSTGLPKLPSWAKNDCEVYNLQKAVEKLRKGKIVYFRPAYITWKCAFKISFSYLTKGLVPCETPILVTAFIRAHYDGRVPVFEVNWSGPLVGTGRNVWRGVSSFSDEFKHILEHFIPVS